MEAAMEAANRLEVLFVDPEPAALAATANLLRRDRERYRPSFAGSLAAARAMLAERRFDVVVCDIQLGDGTALELLGGVKTEQPWAARVVLSAEARHDVIARLHPVTHQFIVRPCDATVLRASLARAHELNRLLADPAIKRAVGIAERLPQLPDTFVALDRALGRADVSTREIAAIIERDAVASARLLQAANSAFFRASRALTSVQAATAHLGIETVKSLVLAAHLLATERLPVAVGRVLGSLQSRAMRRVAFVRTLVGRNAVVETATGAALLLDLGTLVLARADAENYGRVARHATGAAISLGAAERALLGVDHGEAGAYLLGLWGLPFPLVEAIAWHHQPARIGNGEVLALAAVHVADALVDGTESSLDFSYLAGAGLPGSPAALAAAIETAALTAWS